MRLSRKYAFDWKFYLISVLFIVVLSAAFLFAYRMMIRAQGREVQRLLTKTNLGEIEYSEQQARNYVNRLAAQHNLTQRERAQAEDIFTRAFYQRMQIWIEDRLAGKSEQHTRQRQGESWNLHQQEFQHLLSARTPSEQ